MISIIYLIIKFNNIILFNGFLGKKYYSKFHKYLANKFNLLKLEIVNN